MNILGEIGVIKWSIVADYRGIWLSEDNWLIRSLVIEFFDTIRRNKARFNCSIHVTATLRDREITNIPL